MKVNSSTLWRLLGLLVILAFAKSGYAQSTTGTFTGTVTDINGAVIPNAKVTLTNEASGDVRETVSNSDGYFTLAAIPSGAYTVKVETTGFGAWTRTGIELRSGDKINLTDISLKPGGVGDSVTIVSGDQDIAPIDSGEKSAVITSKQIQNLSIVGRNALELVKILPGFTPRTTNNKPNFSGEVAGIHGNGVTSDQRQSAMGNYSANGGRVESLDVVIDGAHNIDPSCNCGTPTNANPDMIGEIKALQSNFSAEHAKGPVVLNIVGKSGGKDFHGTLYAYLRSQKLNSNEWLLNKIGNERPKSRFFYPGFNIGGPVLIPGTKFNKSREKLFFFVGFEAFRQKFQSGIVRSWVPTEAMRNGDFSDAAYLASMTNGFNINSQPTGDGIINGRIPQSMIDPGGKILVNTMPLPNVNPAQTGGYNYIFTPVVDQNMTQTSARIDYSISQDTKVFVRFNRQKEIQPFPVGLWWFNPGDVPYPTPIIGNNSSHSGSASLTHVFNPTLTNETILAVTTADFPLHYQDPTKASRAALKYPYKGVFKNDVEQLPYYTSWGGGPGTFSVGGLGFSGAGGNIGGKRHLFSVADNLTKVASTHTLKMGAFFETSGADQLRNNPDHGGMQLAPWGGNSTGNTVADLLLGRVAGYTESSRNIRTDLAYKVAEVYVQDSWKATPKLTLEYGARFSHFGAWYPRSGEGRASQGFAIFDSSKYNPKAGLGDLSGVLWHDRDKSVPLGGVNASPLFVAPRFGFAYDLGGNGKTILRGGFGVFRYQESQIGYGDTINAPAGVRSVDLCCGLTLAEIEKIVPSTTKTSLTALAAGDRRRPVTYSWSATIQRRLPYGLMIETAYVGNTGRNLMNDRGQANINGVPFGAMLSNPSGNPDDYRPFKLYGAITSITHDQYQNYHGWQSILSRQRGRLNLMASYTFSKTLGFRGAGFEGSTGTGFGTANSVNLRETSYGVLGFDRTHVLNLSYSYLLPSLIENKFVGAFTNGWQLSGISNWFSGAPITTFGITGTMANGKAVDNRVILGSPDVPLVPVLTCDPRKGLTSGQAFNPNCFALPQVGSNGTYILPYLRGPAYMNHDLSLFKNFNFNESRKFQFRASAFNFLNHPLEDFDSSNLNLNFKNGKLDNPNFGLKPKDNKFGRRVIQLALKFYF